MAHNLTNKIKALEKIAEEIKNCEECKKHQIGLLVPGKGNPNAKIMFVGEAAGPTESKIGEPFVGRSGKFLTELLSSIDIKREEVFITSPVKYYPGKRVLTGKEILHGKAHLLKQIEIIKPRLIVLLGNVALKALFPDKNLFTSKIHGKPIKKDNIIYFPTYHPAAGMRFPKVRERLIKDFKKLREILNKNKIKLV